MKVLQIIYYQVYNIAPLFLGSYYNSKNEVKVLGTGYPFLGVTLTPNLTPHLGSFLLLKKSSFYSQSHSENGVIFTPYMGCFSLFGVNLTLKVE